MSSRRQREVLSPIVTTPNIPQRLHSQSSRISPSLKASNTGANSPSTLLMEPHNDELERKARRRSRVMDLQMKNMGSPSSPSDRRKSIPLQGFSTAQLTEHYTSCIKLSAENKINAKNAFGLHLIDYMSELLKKKELENFQVASTTLDASAKIYAGRVDAIHAETYKVLSGLGRGVDKQKNAPEGDDGPEAMDGDDDENKTGKEKKKKKRKSKTIETNLKNINVTKLDLEFEVDPLFKMMSAAFDEGGSSGLLLSNLRTFDNTQSLVLDSNTLITPVDDLNTSRLEERQNHVDVTEYKDLFTSNLSKDLKVCPAFSSFRFTNWDSTDEESVAGITASQEEHRFDIDAEPEPIHDTHDNMSMMGAGDGSYIHDDDNDDIADTNFDDNIGRDNCIGDGRAAQLVQSVLSDMTHSTTGALIQVLSTEHSDYSYFNKALLRTWAGPSHWRAGNLCRDLSKTSITTSKLQKKKGKKQTFRLDFDEKIDFDSLMKPSKTTSLTKSTLTKYSRDQTTLPKDHHYDADLLFRLFFLKQRLMKRQQNSANVDDAIETYDYENTHDKENYCPNDYGDDDDNDDGEVDFGNFGEAGDTDELFSSQDPFSQSQDTFTQGQTLAADGTVLSDDKLLAQPYKVEKIGIDYAKTAKKLDVKRVKSSMWNLLKSAPKQTSGSTDEEDTNNSANLGTSETEPGTSKEMEGHLRFQELLNDLPGKVSGQTARNLSVPTAFVCLLHLANEKSLKIEEIDMVDLMISQGP
ncbi:hypothetical protein ACF0H5_008700 [Mactra antiquata]